MMRFTDEQQQAITGMRPLVCVAAGAGSGKTSILVERVAHLLEHPELWPDEKPELERVAAITFTDKAAAEMKARLRAKFRAKPAQDDPSGMRFWREMERQVENARITTIHAFCASILREHALRIGIDPEWRVPGDAESAQLAEKIVVRTLQRLLEEEHPAAHRLSLRLSRNEIKQALLQVLTRRAWFEECASTERYADPERLWRTWEAQLPVLHETYLRDLYCAPELLRLIELLRGLDGCSPGSDDKLELRRRGYLELLKDMGAQKPDLWQRITAVVAAHKGARASKAWQPEYKEWVQKALKEVADFFNKQCAPPSLAPDFDRLVAEMSCDLYHVGQIVVEAGVRMRRTQAFLDFEDMIDIALRLLRESAALRRRVAATMRFLLIDEFQDTDARQLEIAQLLCHADGGPDLFIVGDAKQSIYYFRGAEVGLFRDMLSRDEKRILLSRNFRSLPDVLCFVNEFFMRSGLLDAVERYQPMQAARPPLSAPRVEIFAPMDAAPGKADIASVRRENDALYVARRIREMCDPAAPLMLNDGRGGVRAATYDDIVLLFRRGSYMHEYEAALRDADIPFNRIAGAGYFKRREILDMIALLNLVQDPWDEDALLTVLRGPMVCLSDESLLRMARWAGGLAAAFHRDDVPDDLEQRETLDAARDLFNELYAERHLPPGALLRRILERTQVEAVLLSQHLGLQKVSNLRKMVAMADEFGHAQAASIAEFVRYLQEMSVRDIREGEASLQARGLGAVTLMTIHKAKGLEFPVVFLPETFVGTKGGDQQPLSWHPRLGLALKAPDRDGTLTGGAVHDMIGRIRRQAEQAEMARLLYVAMTRACDYLVLCGHANPKKLSWAESLNLTFDLDARTHGDTVTGDGWQAVIKRDVPPACTARTLVEAKTMADPQCIAAAIAPVTANRQGQDAVSVSYLLSLMHEDAEDALDVEPEKDADATPEDESSSLTRIRSFAMTRGVLAHRMFELWDFKQDLPPDLDMLVKTAQLGLEHQETAKKHLEAMIAGLRGSNQWPLFREARTVLRETPFLLDIGPALLRGVIDAVIEDNIIVDYKTGKSDPEKERRYETQLLLYAAAMFRLRGRLPDRGMIWYADHGTAHEIAFSEPAVEDVLERARGVLQAPC